MDLGQMVMNCSTTTSTVMWKLLFALGGLVGMVYIGTALLRMQRASRFPGQNPVTVGDIVPIILVGALLANLGAAIDRAWNSFGTGTVSFGPIAYAGAQEVGRLAGVVDAVLTLASVAGGIFFFRGLLLLKQAAHDGQSSQGADDTVYRALTHMVGGVGLVQFHKLIDAFCESLSLLS